MESDLVTNIDVDVPARARGKAEEAAESGHGRNPRAPFSRRGGIEDAEHRARVPAPDGVGRLELAAAPIGQAIEPRAPVVLRQAPLGIDPPFVLEPVQRLIQRAVLDVELAIGAHAIHAQMP